MYYFNSFYPLLVFKNGSVATAENEFSGILPKEKFGDISNKSKYKVPIILYKPRILFITVSFTVVEL